MKKFGENLIRHTGRIVSGVAAAAIIVDTQSRNSTPKDAMGRSIEPFPKDVARKVEEEFQQGLIRSNKVQNIEDKFSSTVTFANELEKGLTGGSKVTGPMAEVTGRAMLWASMGNAFIEGVKEGAEGKSIDPLETMRESMQGTLSSVGSDLLTGANKAANGELGDAALHITAGLSSIPTIPQDIMRATGVKIVGQVIGQQKEEIGAVFKEGSKLSDPMYRDSTDQLMTPTDHQAMVFVEEKIIDTVTKLPSELSKQGDIRYRDSIDQHITPTDHEAMSLVEGKIGEAVKVVSTEVSKQSDPMYRDSSDLPITSADHKSMVFAEEGFKVAVKGVVSELAKQHVSGPEDGYGLVTQVPSPSSSPSVGVKKSASIE